MNQERWQELKVRLEESFEIVSHTMLELDPGPGKVERIVFRTPSASMKAEFTTKPRVVGERGMGSRRIGGDVSIQKVYSTTETVCTLKLFRQQGDDWTELSADAIP